jgi:flagellar biosynthesis/type III secretory pathway protein FliH
VQQVLGQLLGSDVQEAYVTEGERLIQQGLEKGREEGLEKGREETRRLVLRQLELRFGPLPQWAQARIESADSNQLGQVAERVLTASTLEEALQEQ